MHGLWEDVRVGWRILLKSAGFTGVLILMLALGIGGNTAIFSLLDAVMLQSLPVRNPAELVVPRWSARDWPQNTSTNSFGDCGENGNPSLNSGGCSFSYPFFAEVAAQKDLFSSVAAFAGPVRLDLSGNGPAMIVNGELVSGDYFDTLGVRATFGRTLNRLDEQLGSEPVVVLGYGYWQRAFGGVTSAIGKTVQLNGIVFTIVGIIDPTFARLTPGKSIDMWLPIAKFVPLGLHWGSRWLGPQNWWLTLIARLKAGKSAAHAQEALSLQFRNVTLHGEEPAFRDSDDPRVILRSAEDALAGIRANFGEPLFLSMALVGLVLLIVCANVAGLMLVRTDARRKEIAVRLALGATRMRVIQQLLTESLLLSVIGGGLGVLFAYWSARGLARFVAANSYHPLKIDLQVDARVLAFAVALTLLTAIIFGLAPALYGTHFDVGSALKGNSVNFSRGVYGSSRRFGLGGSLVLCQITLSVVVLIGAGLLLRTLDNLAKINPGFDTRNLLLFSINPTLAGYKIETVQNVYDQLERRLIALPGVISASYSSFALLNGGRWTEDVNVPGQSEKNKGETQMLAVGPGFFETMRIPLIKGRTFRTQDVRSTQLIAVVNQAFVRNFVEFTDPIGVHFEENNQRREIIGVVADTKYDELQNQNAPTVYIPLTDGEATFAVRSATRSTAIPDVRRVVNDVDENLPVYDVQTQSQVIDRLLFGDRLVGRLSSTLGILALILTCTGLFGRLSYEVARREHEMGIRMALGAQQSDILSMLIREGLILVCFGALVGLVVASALTRYLQSFLFGVRPADPLTYLAVCVILGAVALLSCYIPARRATRSDPALTLRHE